MLTSLNKNELLFVLKSTPASQNIMLAGKHGIGKSEIITNFFTQQGDKVVTMFCSQAADPGDIIGLPRLNETTGVTEFALPWWWPTDGQPVVLFLDELNRARPEILQVVMDLTLNRKLAGKKLPEGSRVIAAVNCGDEYTITDLDPALVSRFNVYKFDPTVTDWIEWANASHLDGRVIAFISQNSTYLDNYVPDDSADSTLSKYADRRAWKRVSDVLLLKPEINTSLKKTLCGIIGGKAAVAFFEMLRNDTLVTAEDILTNFDGCKSHLDGCKIQDFTMINDNICSYIETSIGDDFDSVPEMRKTTIAANLYKYIEYLDDTKHGHGSREAVAHLINNYEGQNYINFNQLVASYPTTLERKINEFIISVATN